MTEPLDPTKLPLILWELSGQLRADGKTKWDSMLTKGMREVQRLPCKQNCRTNREAWIAAADWGRDYMEDFGSWPTSREVAQGYAEWKRG